MDQNIIVDSDGVLVCTRVSRAEVKKLQDKRMVLPHKRKRGCWWALVAPALIKHQLRRKITLMVPAAEANRTVREVHFDNPKGSGSYYEPNFRTCFGYGTTPACAAERELRQLPKAA